LKILFLFLLVASIKFGRRRCSVKNAISNMMRVESTVEIAEALFRPIKNPSLEMQVILLWWKEEESFAFVQDVISTLKWGTVAGYAEPP
jgi:hypothetical protein